MMLLSLAVDGRAGGAEVGTAMPSGAEAEDLSSSYFSWRFRLTLSACSQEVCGRNPIGSGAVLAFSPMTVFA
jgi:hypothetical protein